MRVTIGNSYSQLQDLTPTQFKQARQLLSYQPPKQYGYKQLFNTRRYLLDAKGFFPTGLIPMLMGKYPNIQVTDNRVIPGVGSPKPLPQHAYPDQVQAINAARAHGRGIISMPTGTGKSFVIRLIIEQFNLKTLVIVPTVELKRQLTETLKGLSHVVVENIDSNALKRPINADLLILDEFHHAAAKTYQKLNKAQWKGIYYRFGLTATPWRNNEEENILLEAILGKVIHTLSYKDAIKKGYIVPVEAYYYDLPKQAVKGHTYAQVYNELIVNNKSRNELIATLIQNCAKAKVASLTLVKEIKHGDLLAEATDAGFASGADSESRWMVEAFNSAKLKTLIGTSGIVGEGVDTKSCEYVIIADLGKAKGQFLQKVGRAVRKYPGKETAKVILFRDSSHRFTLSHFNAQKRTLLDAFGIVPIKLEM